MAHKYTMTISRLTVDKLGVKLYDRVSAVIAELIANSYDADARSVRVEAPMGELLANKVGDELRDKGFEIVIEDDGIGMTPDEVNDFYLRVGRERRLDPKRGDVSKELGRKVMGRKGVGKLAPFGICQSIELITAGGEKTSGHDLRGKKSTGYVTAHLFLEKNRILKDTDDDYHPRAGDRDGLISPTRGTKLILRNFAHRHVPDIEDFARQVSQRFGIQQASWKIALIDNTKTTSHADRERVVGSFDVELMEDTALFFEQRPAKRAGQEPSYVTKGADGKVREDIPAGVALDNRFYPITGWLGYSKHPYKDDLMAGVRIYCRGKIASQTSIFNRKAGFTGEHDIRSYLVGELHTDWLDEEEDLIQTDRRDILWSHELGRALEEWGQRLVVQLGRIARNPMKKRTWDLFLEVSKIEQKIDRAFPGSDQAPIRDGALGLAKLMAQNLRHDELDDSDHVKSLVQLTMNLAPHVTLNEKLREAAEDVDSPLAVVSQILKTARIAELSAFGLIADERVRVITRVEELKDDSETLEAAMQELITHAPWLVNPQWSPIVSNQTFATLREEFRKLYKKKTGQDLDLTPMSAANKRADFVMEPYEGTVQIIEIKRPSYKIGDDDFGRLNVYVDLMTEFLDANPTFKTQYVGFHITLVCDGVALSSVSRKAFDGLKKDGILTQINWTTFLLRTRKMHEDFLREAEKQKKNAAKDE
ncbi:MAG: ATP-binding protein [Labilithrix sp.]|nr:ATP-binding protein [Labilithrix sp.]